MKKPAVSRMCVRGYKSIRECDLALGNLNVLIGSNGAGKSSFLQVFSLLQRMATGRLQVYVGQCGGPDALLWYGAGKIRTLHLEVTFADGRTYACTLEPAGDNRLLFADERVQDSEGNTVFRETGHFESRLAAHSERHKSLQEVLAAMRSWHPLHMNDTGTSSGILQRRAINDNLFLRSDGSNLSPILFLLKNGHPQHYNRLVRTIRLAVPFFRDFVLRPCQDNKGQIELYWTEHGCDVPLKGHQLSDAIPRFMCLATLLLLPEELKPATILIDEPELGLHPYALKLLAGILRSTSHTRQIIISTQSVALVDEFAPENIIVADRSMEGTLLHRLDVPSLTEWLEEYSPGELWQKNLLGGRP